MSADDGMVTDPFAGDREWMPHAYKWIRYVHFYVNQIQHLSQAATGEGDVPVAGSCWQGYVPLVVGMSRLHSGSGVYYTGQPAPKADGRMVRGRGKARAERQHPGD